ncbi:MAG: sigma-70 family RNA polymerase sigma factor, partial [Flavitalea sp.]
WQNIQLYRFHPENEGSLSRYLQQVVKNKWLDHLRSARNRLTVPLHIQDSAEEISALPEDQQQKLDSVKRHFERLGNTCREVLKRFYYNRESLRTIALAMNWTEATARNNKYRCIQQMKELVQTNNFRDEQR